VWAARTPSRRCWPRWTSADAIADDGYALASAELAAGRRDEALVIFGQLLERGFDLGAAVRKDRHLAPEQRYQIGFALIERRNSAGEEILSDLAGSGRSKVAAMAKAKLKSAGYLRPVSVTSKTLQQRRETSGRSAL
jgi:hypothetical protein